MSALTSQPYNVQIQIFNENLFDEMTVSEIIRRLESYTSEELEGIKDFGQLIRYYKNNKLGFVGDNDEKYYARPGLPLTTKRFSLKICI
jgi:hypothetical protein